MVVVLLSAAGPDSFNSSEFVRSLYMAHGQEFFKGKSMNAVLFYGIMKFLFSFSTEPR